MCTLPLASPVYEEAVIEQLIVDMVTLQVLEIDDLLFEVGDPVSDSIPSSLSDGSSDPLNLFSSGQVYSILDIESFRKSCLRGTLRCGGSHGP